MKNNLLFYTSLLVGLCSCAKDGPVHKFSFIGRVICRFDSCSAMTDTSGTSVYIVQAQQAHEPRKMDTINVLGLPANVVVGDVVQFNYRRASEKETAGILCKSLFLPPHDPKVFTEVKPIGM